MSTSSASSENSNVSEVSLRPIGFWEHRRLRSQTKEFLKAVRKQRLYKSDLLTPEQLAEVNQYESDLIASLKRDNPTDYLPLLERGDQLALAVFPIRSGDTLRENIEVVLVAIVAALSLRAYFLQPFKIPTDSMKPTLYGIQTTPTDTAPPNWFFRFFDQVLFGETHGLVRLNHPVTLVGMVSGTVTPWFEYTDLQFDTGETRRVWINRSALENKLGLRIEQHFAANESVVEFVNETGDQVLVNKLIYNFRLPHRGEVFVFRTNGIAGIENDLRRRGIMDSQFYIKRCVGVPGDTLRINPPLLEVNGSAENGNWAMKRVEAAEKGYRGYGFLDSPAYPQLFLRGPEETYDVEKDSFWAMGDNSYDSLDSRFWGPVPRPNLVGTGAIIYWPFSVRWGLIR